MVYALEFFLILILQSIGISFGVLQKVLELDKKSPDDSLSDVFSMFWKTDRVTVLISSLVLSLQLVAHLIFLVFAPSVREISVVIPVSNWITFFPDIPINYLVVSFFGAFLLGFFGQKFVYKVLGKFEKKVIEKLNLDA